MIKIIKLITGEELIGDVSPIDGQFVIDQPCAIQLMPSRTDPSKTMMGLIPYASYTVDFRVTVKESMIVWQETPSSEIYNQYNAAFGSGIQLVNM